MDLGQFDSLQTAYYSYVTMHGKKSEGTLLRARQGKEVGYSCLHSWPHLGDAPLEDLLKELKSNKVASLLNVRALENLSLDLKARAVNMSLLSDIQTRSHLQVNLEKDLSPENIENFRDRGFKYIKVKLSKDFESSASKLNNATQYLGDIKIRIDFNSCLNHNALQTFLKSLSEGALDCIDFIEDPFILSKPWEEIQKTYQIRLAADFQKNKLLAPNYLECFDVLVIKPAFDDLNFWISYAHTHMKRVVFTSYMQHPVGQAFDFFHAAKFQTEHPLLCDDTGFLSLETANYSQDYNFLSPVNAQISLKSQKFGIGFSDVLEKEEWLTL